MLLKLSDSLADRGLGYVEFFCRRTHFSGVRYGNEDFQMAYGHNFSFEYSEFDPVIRITYELYKIIFLSLCYCKWYNRNS